MGDSEVYFVSFGRAFCLLHLLRFFNVLKVCLCGNVLFSRVGFFLGVSSLLYKCVCFRYCFKGLVLSPLLRVCFLCLLIIIYPFLALSRLSKKISIPEIFLVTLVAC